MNRGLAAWVIGLLGAGATESNLEKLAEDDLEITLWLDGTDVTYRVSELATQALGQIVDRRLRIRGLRN